ncbi:hypothetical protein EYF80_024450 [Liparis tanakae]|uniref:Uncharacterized protein n=1 Tax=Liparis tanakae TaxID=230148 RepID=A0A4Z2HHQ3_9TELE|nr:hypothetical protein EYF80_024450 [Liparis tanakae]
MQLGLKTSPARGPEAQPTVSLRDSEHLAQLAQLARMLLCSVREQLVALRSQRCSAPVCKHRSPEVEVLVYRK